MNIKLALLLCISMILILCFSGLVISVSAEEIPISVVLDGKTIDFGGDQLPVLAESDRILIPIRKIFESIGAKLDWSAKTNTATVTNGNLSLVLTIGEKIAKINNSEVTLEQPAELINNRTMVPVRFVCEALGAKVDWNAQKKSVLITTSIVDNENVVAPSPSITDTPKSATDKKNIKVLAIGNSFTEDSSYYLHDIAAADDIDLTIVTLYIGGCSLETHWKNASEDTAAYDYQLNGVSEKRKVSIKETLQSDTWDYVTLQQLSSDSGKEETYYPYIENLAKYIKTLEPQATLYIHQTWAYEKGSNHPGFPYYDSNQITMFNALVKAYNTAATKVGLLTLDDGKEISPEKKPIKLIPCGKAMQNARATKTYDTTFRDGYFIRLNRDGYHASHLDGRYLLGAVWYECITGNKIASNSFWPDGLGEEEIAILKKAAHEAVVEYGW